MRSSQVKMRDARAIQKAQNRRTKCLSEGFIQETLPAFSVDQSAASIGEKNAALRAVPSGIF